MNKFQSLITTVFISTTRNFSLLSKHFSISFPSNSPPFIGFILTADRLAHIQIQSRIFIAFFILLAGARTTKFIFCAPPSNTRWMLAPASSLPPSKAHEVAPDAQVKAISGLLTGTNDDHGGVVVEMTKEPMDASLFISLLRTSVSHWRQQGKRGVWIKMPIELANLVDPAVKEGFYFHHAEPQYLMLVYWIPETACTLPVNATHRVGIGAFVMNKNGEVLVVQEKSGTFRGTGVWKLPTGVVDQGEDICDAAVREVKEETGIETKFVEILAFRQSHKSFFDKSDLFFVCHMDPLSFEIQVQETEIEAAQWMPFEEYATQPFIQKNELLQYIVDICASKRDGKYSGFSPVPTTTSFSSKSCHLYLNKRSLINQ